MRSSTPANEASVRSQAVIENIRYLAYSQAVLGKRGFGTLGVAQDRDEDGARAPSRIAPGRRALTDRLATTSRSSAGSVDAANAEPAGGAAAGTAAGAAPGGATATIVPDGAEHAAGQLTRSEFLQRLREAVTRTAASAMGPAWSADSCPYIDQWFAAHAATEPGELEALARRYSQLGSARSATDFIAPVCARLGAAIGRHQQGGDIGGELAAAGVPASAVPPAKGNEPGQLGAGTPLDPATMTRMSEAMGENFEGVRIHTDPRAAQMAAERSALAFTVGRHVVFGAGHYNPGTPAGDALLAHELSHVVQQRGASHDAPPSIGSVSDAPDHNAEAAADEAAAGAVAQLHGPAGSQARRGVASRIASVASSPLRLQRCDKQQQPAPPAASVTISPMSYNGSPNRLPPGQSASIAVNISGLPPGQTVAMDVLNSGTASGSATVTAGQSLTSSGNVTIQGGTQTTPGNANTLQLRARVAGTTVGTGPGFTVAAWPRDFTTSLAGDLDEPNRVGVRATNDWTSDGTGGKADLTEADRSELVGLDHRDNPPFTSAGGTSTTSGTSGYIAGTATPRTDTHSYGRASINTAGLAAGAYTIVYTQLFILRCRRTGVNDVVCPNSGFTITHTARWNSGTSRWNHDCVKTPAATTVGAFSSSAGGGGASSNVHVL